MMHSVCSAKRWFETGEIFFVSNNLSKYTEIKVISLSSAYKNFVYNDI